MGNLTISTNEVLAVVAGAATIVTAIWHAAMYVGKLTVRVQGHEMQLKDHDARLSDHDNELRFIKSIQK